MKMEILDNKLNKFGDDLKEEIKFGDKCNIASAVFYVWLSRIKKTIRTN